MYDLRPGSHANSKRCNRTKYYSEWVLPGARDAAEVWHTNPGSCIRVTLVRSRSRVDTVRSSRRPLPISLWVHGRVPARGWEGPTSRPRGPEDGFLQRRLVVDLRFVSLTPAVLGRLFVRSAPPGSPSTGRRRTRQSAMGNPGTRSRPESDSFHRSRTLYTSR